MEKRNFVTNARTPKASADDVDAVLEAGMQAFSLRKEAKGASEYEKRASAEDEKADSEK